MAGRRSSLAPVSRHPRRFSPLLAGFALIFAGWWIAVLTVVIIDPLDLYPWGKSLRLRDADYYPDPSYLVDVVAKLPGMDVLLIGSSTAAPFTRAMLREAYPGSADAFNLSYVGSRPGDRAQVTAEVARFAHAKHVLISIDWTYVLSDATAFSEGFPSYLYDHDPSNDMRAVGLGTMRLALEALRNQPLWRPDWDYGRYLRQREHSYKAFQTPAMMDRLAASVRAHRGDVDAPTPRTCRDFPALNDQLVPFARAMAARGIKVDTFFPPYSPAFYFEWIDDPSRRALTGNFAFSDQALLRRCVVQRLSDLPGVRVHGFDNDGWVSDLKNYSDTGHPFGADIYRYLVSAISGGSHALTTRSIDAYLAKLHHNVKYYNVTNARFVTVRGAGS